MTMDKVETRFFEILCACLPDLQKERYEPGTMFGEGIEFVDHLDMDSLDLAILIVACEDECGVLFSGEDLDRVRTVGEALELINKELGQ